MTTDQHKITIHSAIDDILDFAVHLQASDIFFSDASAIIMKVQGRFERVTEEELNPKEIARLIGSISQEEDMDYIKRQRQSDWATATAAGRFRISVGHQQNSMYMVVRTIPNEVIPAEQLGTPQHLIQAASRTKGLILVTGPTGSGKSTTLAGLINHINETRACHILTLEDPIEFSHSHKQALINQRNLGTDFLTWNDGLKAAMRQAPDVILIGEMRDQETVAAALKAAETGHLVMATLHTNGAAETINRIVEFFPHEAHKQIQSQLAANIVAIMSQQLIPSRKSPKRVMAYELLLRNQAIVANIRNLDLPGLVNTMSTSSKVGMIQMDYMLASYVAEGHITYETALERCTDPNELTIKLGLLMGNRSQKLNQEAVY